MEEQLLNGLSGEGAVVAQVAIVVDEGKLHEEEKSWLVLWLVFQRHDVVASVMHAVAALALPECRRC